MKDIKSVDLDKTMILAEELGIKVTKHSENFGFYVATNGERKILDVIDLFVAIFPEIADSKYRKELGGQVH
ncbi:hypothetical protein [Paenibacillus sp. LK1]|uniref:hypothetical protein n=1 Tax=Paenibacillus sp. LK1 TaxID=2053014 RepID=UPI000C18356B|nr:hypothetical protein [Paenibacillus sp. LK1]PIH59082.1 hypothetical protein CS562_14155 [Paenibacillus sp. LK1]